MTFRRRGSVRDGNPVLRLEAAVWTAPRGAKPRALSRDLRECMEIGVVERPPGTLAELESRSLRRFRRNATELALPFRLGTPGGCDSLA
jgi:hypothetical protein